MGSLAARWPTEKHLDPELPRRPISRMDLAHSGLDSREESKSKSPAGSRMEPECGVSPMTQIQMEMESPECGHSAGSSAGSLKGTISSE